MAQLRKVYKTGSVTVINYPEVFRDLCNLGVGDTAELSCYTARSLLMEIGVSDAVAQQIPLGDAHFIVVRRHEPED